MWDIGFVYRHIPKLFGALAFIVNPIFVYLIFTEKSTKFGNYKYLLLYFASFNLVYSVANVVVPIDIHSHRYCFYLFISDGLFFGQSDWHLHMLSARCALVSASYAVLLSHFIYRYLALHNSELTNDKFHTYMTISFGIFCVYFVVWHASCFYLGGANLEIKEYIRTDFRDFYRMDSMDMNMISCLYREGTDHTLLRSWSTTILWTSISAISICMFLMLACMIMKKLNKMSSCMSKKTSTLQLELLRALIIQTVIPIFVSFFPCVISFIIPIFDLDLGRPINYVEVIALGAFAFCDPVAIVLCLPVFRQRVLCQKKKPKKKQNTEINMMSTIAS
ncbi:Serpentine Receptor, class J [Caenorhabditis elegans]|uniref:Serpentine Receptor, class J n=1 Tax=Caenorhabditis elegans TaxID=6239 RepID=Q9GUC0_CAEEL|nr:Serpentine Receptor, class J [Caenorhabditis elegans]CCD70348.1 Serpentine Receptor, class J [Caenorhabditis elegans]|eukprot:NP_503275.1 Serpentine Receptor, class J [Caenorhabditis elegans]